MMLVGWFWHYPQVTYVRGVVVESQPLNPPSVHRITYEYTANGLRYRGQRIMRLSTQFEPFYTVGSFFPVYFVTAHPEQSYGPGRPYIQPLIYIGIFLIGLCSIVIFFAGPR